MKILGIDPGTATTGYGIVAGEQLKGSKKESFFYCSHGCITTAKELAQKQRLQILEREVARLISEHQPQIVAVETLFFSKNQKTAMAVSEARGVILLAAANHKLPVYEFSPLQVKMAITGYGRAQKTQVQQMISELLSLAEIPKPDDAADALGVALTCFFALSNPVFREQNRPF